MHIHENKVVRKDGRTSQRNAENESPFHKDIRGHHAENTGAGESRRGRPFWSLSGAKVQANLKVGPANDSYEREADQMAEQVVSGGVLEQGKIFRSWDGRSGIRLKEEEEETVQGKCEACEKEGANKRVQRKADGGSMDAPRNFSGALTRRSGQGMPMSREFRSRMESGFGHDFGGVRIHTDGEANRLSRQINARAFTHGSDIYFGKGEYQPSSVSGQRLLAHELTHTIQQGVSPKNSRERVQRKGDPGPPAPSPECKIVTETVTAKIADRTRKRIGVGEEVNLKLDPLNAATWSIASGSGTLTPPSGSVNTVKFTAADKDEKVKVKAVAGAESCQVEFDVKEPTSWIMEKAPGYGKRHKSGRPDVGWKGQFYFQPNDVYFYNLERREKDSAYTGTGSYAGYNGDLHGNYPGGAGHWFAFTDHVAGKGSIATGAVDTIYTGDPGAGVTGAAPPFVVGSGYFPITLQWRANGGAVHDMGIQNQEDEIFSTGKVESRKGGHTESAMWNDATSTY